VRNKLGLADVHLGIFFAVYACFFCFISSYYVLRPLQQGFILDELGYQILPYVYLAVTLATFVFNQGYNWLYNNHTVMRFTSMLMVLFISSNILFFLIFKNQFISGKIASFLFYLYISIYSVTLSSLFWSSTTLFFNPQQQKRLFGLFASSGSLGGMLGAALTTYLVKQMEAYYCILVSIVVLALGWLALVIADTLNGKSPSAPINKPQSGVEKRPNITSWKQLTQDFKELLLDPYSVTICLIMLSLTLAANTLLDIYMKSILDGSLAGKAEKTQIFGLMYSVWNGLSMLFDFVLVPRLHRLKLGPVWGMLTLPVFGLTCGLLFFFPSWQLVVFLSILFSALRFSFYNTSLALLFAPLEQAQRYKTQGYVHMFVYRFGSGFGSVLAILLKDVLGLDVFWLGIFSMPMIAYWLWLVWIKLKPQYLQLLNNPRV